MDNFSEGYMCRSKTHSNVKVLLVDLHLRTKADLYSFMQGSFVKIQDLTGYVSKYMLNAT